MKCHICNKELKNNLAFSMHLRAIHNLSLLDYNIQYNNFKVPKCLFCENNAKHKNAMKFRKTCGSKECISKVSKLQFWSEEARENIRKKRFEYLKKRTGKTAFERRNKGEMSYLEQWFFDNVILYYNLLEKYDIVNELPEYPYFIDFAFLNIKLAVELDGACHYNHGKERLEHDYKKDEILEKKGWKIFRISYNENTQDKINEFMEILQNIEIYKSKLFENRIYKFSEIKKLQNKKKHRTQREYFDDVKKETKKRYQDQRILLKDINFNNKKWKKEVAKIFNCKEGRAKSIIRDYFCDIWQNCYKPKYTLKLGS